MKKKIVVLVLVVFFASCEAIFVDNLSSDTLETLAPSNGSSVTAGAISFNWQKVASAETYQLQIATPNFTNASQVFIDTTLVKTFFVKELPIGDYQWRVKALNSGYETSYTTNSFTVQ